MRNNTSTKHRNLIGLNLLMAKWVDIRLEKSRTERMSVRDHPTSG